MTRHQADREDLLTESVNMPQRGRIVSAASDRVWVIGWRHETAASLFDDADPVFQFNTSGHLRRVFLDGHKLAAHDGKLTRLQQVANETARLTFHYQPLSVQQQQAVQQRLAASLQAILGSLSSPETSITTIGIDTDSFLKRVREFCEIELPVAISLSPSVDG